ncbi:SH3 domain-binding glutamic acid-rich-like protein 3 [Nematolebias whitei]|uniref:SH3 domain-binding glutamic acid-rich-like protein 3 n=1 Tax=Nematolebias whitei TaxID=451745 RepID=UPI00189857B2|nr:SH3 domain-binding glutamic acid-rich-like protein 3 [Nematolebias whitei]
MGVKLYYTTVTASRTVKSQQAEVIRILDSKSIQYELIDISVGGELRDEMRSKAGDPTAVPPQLFNEDQYCGVRGHISSDSRSGENISAHFLSDN